MTNTEDSRMLSDCVAVILSSFVIIMSAALLMRLMEARMYGLVGFLCLIFTALTWLYAWSRTGWSGAKAYGLAVLLCLAAAAWWPHIYAATWFGFLFLGMGIPAANIAALVRQLCVEFDRVKAAQA